MNLNTLWDLIDRPLAYHSREGVQFTVGVGVTLPGSSALQVAEDWRADRCVRDPNLLRNLQHSCQALLEQCSLSTTIKLDYDSVAQAPYPRVAHLMNDEEEVKGFLGRHWLQGVEIIVKEVLRQKGVEGSFDFVRGSHGHQIPDWLAKHRNQTRCIVEGKSETVMNAHYKNLLERADNDTEIVWAETSAGTNTANLLYKVQRLLSWLVSVC
jgi:hypothetical protein